jgi:quinol monooxygenase YgiN
MIIVTGHLLVAPAERDAYLEGCVEVVTAARATEGCVDFALSPDLVDEGRINVAERWTDEAALTAFRGSGPSGEQQATILGGEVVEHVADDGRSLLG